MDKKKQQKRQTEAKNEKFEKIQNDAEELAELRRQKIEEQQRRAEQRLQEQKEKAR